MFKPLNDYVLMKRDEKKEKSSSGLILEYAFKENTYTGTVVAVGPKVEFVNVGDRIHLDIKKTINEENGKSITFDYGKTVVLDGQELVLVCENHIMGILD